MALKKYYMTIIFLLTLFFICSGCGQKVSEFELLSSAGDTYFSSFTTPYSGEGVNITIDEIFENLNDGDDSDDPYVIDFRTEGDFNTSHIKGAHHMDLSDLADNIDSLPTDRQIVTVCYSGQTASFATAIINLVGLDPDYDGLEARCLKFGMCSVTTDPVIAPKSDLWLEAIETDEFTELETGINTPDTTYDSPDPATGETTLAGIIKAKFTEAAADWKVDAGSVWTSTDNYFIINYWPESHYTDPGHIPGAYKFAPKEDILTTASLDRIPTEEPVAVYCYTGMTSAQVTAYLRLLGCDAHSLLYGMNGFDYADLPASKYIAPANDYTSILE